MTKPTQEELNAWEETLRKEGLGVNRGRNTDRLSYGFKDGASLIRTWDDVRIHIAQKRKPHKPHTRREHKCVTCGSTFLARAKSLCCSSRCRKQRSRSSQIFQPSRLQERKNGNVQ